MIQAEFSRTVRIDTLGATPRILSIAADENERAALVRRFGLIGLDRLEAEVSVSRADADVEVVGALRAAATQACAISGEPVAETIDAPFRLLFRPELTDAASSDEEVEIGEQELDIVFYDGGQVDVGEAVAQTLALALDPFPRAAGADAALKAGLAGQPDARPFGGLGALKDRFGG